MSYNLLAKVRKKNKIFLLIHKKYIILCNNGHVVNIQKTK